MVDWEFALLVIMGEEKRIPKILDRGLFPPKECPARARGPSWNASTSSMSHDKEEYKRFRKEEDLRNPSTFLSLTRSKVSV